MSSPRYFRPEDSTLGPVYDPLYDGDGYEKARQEEMDNGVETEVPEVLPPTVD